MDPVQPENPKAEGIAEEKKNFVSFKLDEPVTTALNISPLTNVSANEGESLSFVVLGKDSVEAQATLLASYVDIQQKSMSIDYKSIVSSLSITEMQNRLMEMLQENVKLKETLRQNNDSMKQQFSTLAMWQEEVTKVHQSHKQKFSETKELINHLKKENAELKNKLLLLQRTEDIEYEMINKSDTISASINQTELEQNTPELAGSISKMAIEKCKDYIISIISEKLADEELQRKLQKLKASKELESATVALNCKLHSDSCAETVESLKCSEMCSVKDQEIASLKESIALLEQKLQCVLAPVKLHDLTETSSNLNRQKFVQNMKQYNDMLQELTECFVEQIERFATIEKGLKEITHILRLDDDNSKMQCKEKLCQYCKQLANEQIKLITDRQTLVKSQNQLQKIFSDYNSVLYELEITIDENAKLNVLKDNSARENLEEQLEQIKRDRQLLDDEIKIFDQERDNLENDKKSLQNQKKNLDMELELLCDKIKLLEQERIGLNEEKMSLDHQSELYENCERDLHNEKNALRAQNEQLLTETNGLRQQIEEKTAEYQRIMEQLAQSAEEIELLRSQLSLYEEDFQQEKRLKETLLEEKTKLTAELFKHINKQLQGSTNVFSSTDVGSVPGFLPEDQPTIDNMKICPKCSIPFARLRDLTEHLDSCLE
ncbi:PREDICTED: flagellar attachment zone protein 1 isoform X2 [Wasmannia auropunctata]|uniref:flagellar attachment zone protein 1 isoform X2 n=1 Tax=Wasmannia auropunctata TaxID=64793 RepID=UPI0005EF7A97|nr:PREDICTED: flagellar attachment zone protein 1 isoform X2 [Wasmannia auropunctata]